MPWSEVLGQDEPIRRLKASAAVGRLGQAYAFLGPAGIGKRHCALAFAQALLCERSSDLDLDACGVCSSCQQVAARQHPDLLLVDLPSGKSEHPVSSFIGDKDERRRAGLCYEIALHPLLGRRKVAVIDEAESLNEEGANALLKTLEEPPPGAILILVVSGQERLLPTIRSRCQLLTFPPLNADVLVELLRRDPDTQSAGDLASIANLAEGSLETARQLLEPELRRQRQSLYEQLSQPRFDSLQLGEFARGLVETASTARSGQRSHAGWIIRFCIEFYRQALLSLARGTAPSTDFAQVARFVQSLNELARGSADSQPPLIDRTVDLLERCLLADRQIEANVAPAVCLESLFDDLGKTLRLPLT
ncbi:MAG: ATP-binding protein [Planctomycetaceae bacterium]